MNRQSIQFSRLIQSFLLLGAFVITVAMPGYSQDSSPKAGRVERIKVHGKGLEGNLAGDSPDRDVSVYLPPSYQTDKKRHYPVIYFLHGFTDSDDKWYGLTKHWINLPAVVDKALAEGKSKEFIIVTPNAYNRYFGSMYSNSVTIGNWEDFVADELVAYIDKQYRTVPQAASRGLAGHSMGGYGTIRIGQKHPEIFSSLYLLSPCCMVPNMNGPSNPEMAARMEGVKTIDDLNKADFGTKAMFASAASWSPNQTGLFPSDDGTDIVPFVYKAYASAVQLNGGRLAASSLTLEHPEPH